jgi:hypothetical protein
MALRGEVPDEEASLHEDENEDCEEKRGFTRVP